MKNNIGTKVTMRPLIKYPMKELKKSSGKVKKNRKMECQLNLPQLFLATNVRPIIKSKIKPKSPDPISALVHMQCKERIIFIQHISIDDNKLTVILSNSQQIDLIKKFCTKNDSQSKFSIWYRYDIQLRKRLCCCHYISKRNDMMQNQ